MFIFYCTVAFVLKCFINKDADEVKTGFSLQRVCEQCNSNSAGKPEEVRANMSTVDIKSVYLCVLTLLLLCVEAPLGGRTGPVL